MLPNWIRMARDPGLRGNLILRSRVLSAIREFFAREGFVEVDPPALVPLAGMEPHLDPFVTELVDQRGDRRPFHLHTSPEYAMKKLLAAGFERIYSLGHAFRNGEVSGQHNPEFMLLEWYRVGADYEQIMEDCEALVTFLREELALEWSITYQGEPMDLRPPWPRLTLREVFLDHTGIDLEEVGTSELFARAAQGLGHKDVDPLWPWEDIFYRVFLQDVEPHLPRERPYFLVDYPVQMASLARCKPEAAGWVERFELYAGGLELGNAFSELTDPMEQRRRLKRDRAQREAMGKSVYPLDESFLQALKRGLPPCAGIALGVDRLVMFFANAPSIRDVLPFPAEDLIAEWHTSYGV